MTDDELCRMLCRICRNLILIGITLNSMSEELEEMKNDSTRKISGEKVNKESDQ